MKTSLAGAVIILLSVMVVAAVLFVVFENFGRLAILFNLMIGPLLLMYKIPILGPIIFIITGVTIYGILVNKPSKKWINYEKSIFSLLLVLFMLGFLASDKYAGTMFLFTCLVGVLYPIMQIVRLETKHSNPRKLKRLFI